MFEKLAAGLLLRGILKELKEANRIAALRLKLEAFKADISLEALEQAEEVPLEAGGRAGAVESLHQTDQEFAQREAMQKLMEEFFHARAKEVPAELDPIEWGKREGYIDRSAGEVDEDVPEIRVHGRPIR